MVFWATLLPGPHGQEKTDSLTDQAQIQIQEMIPNLLQLEIDSSKEIFMALLKQFSPEVVWAGLAQLLRSQKIADGKLAQIVVRAKGSRRIALLLAAAMPQSSSDPVLAFLIKILQEKPPRPLVEIVCRNLHQCLGSKQLQVISALINGTDPENLAHIAMLKGPAAEAMLTYLEKILRQHRQGEARAAAAVVLGTLVASQQRIVPLLTNAFYDKKALVCKAAATSLSKFGKTAIPFLKEALGSPDERVRATAAWAIGKTGNDGKDALPELLVAIGDSAAKVRKPAQWAMENIGAEAVAELTGVLQQPANEQALISALKIVATLPQHFAQAIALITALTGHSNHQVRSSALIAASKIGLSEDKAILVKSLNDSHESVQLAAAEIVSEFDHELPQVVPALIAIAASPNSRIRATVAMALAKAGGHDLQIVQALGTLLQDSEQPVRLATLQALAIVGSGCHHLADAIIDVIARQDSDECVIAALEALCCSELVPSHALPVLLTAIRSANPIVRSKSAMTLAQTGLACCPALIKLAARVNAHVQNDIITTLGQIGAPVISFLLEAIASDCKQTRKVAAAALAKIGEPAFPYLADLLDHDDFWISNAAARALEKNGSKVVPYLLELTGEKRALKATKSAFEILRKLRGKSLPAIIALVVSPKPQHSQFAIQTLKSVNHYYNDAVPELIVMLSSHKDQIVRRSCAWALGKIGESSSQVLQALQNAGEQDHDYGVRSTAQEALRKLKQ